MNLIIIGPQGSGKGVQAQSLSKKLKIPAISVGRLLREEVEKNTDLGKHVQPFIESGRLAPNDLANRVLYKRLKKKDAHHGFILDGFPRTIEQARELPTHINGVLYLDISDATALKRISSRRECQRCGHIYGVDIPSTQKRVCDLCDGRLTRRPDDRPSVAKRRLTLFHTLVRPILSFYRRKGVLRRVKGTGLPRDVHRRLLHALKTLKH